MKARLSHWDPLRPSFWVRSLLKTPQEVHLSDLNIERNSHGVTRLCMSLAKRHQKKIELLLFTLSICFWLVHKYPDNSLA